MTEEESLALQSLDAKIDLLIERQAKIVTVLFDTEGNEGIASKLTKVCEQVNDHDKSIKALATLGRDNRRWLGSITAGLVAVVTAIGYFFLKHIGLTD